MDGANTGLRDHCPRIVGEVSEHAEHATISLNVRRGGRRNQPITVNIVKTIFPDLFMAYNTNYSTHGRCHSICHSAPVVMDRVPLDSKIGCHFPPPLVGPPSKMRRHPTRWAAAKFVVRGC